MRREAIHPSRALRRALQTAERRTQDTGRDWVVVEDRTRGPQVSPFRVKPVEALALEDVVIVRQAVRDEPT
jgi:hypothetical protein